MHILQIWVPAAKQKCYFGMAAIHPLHVFEEPKGFEEAGSGAYYCLLLKEPLLLLHRHAMTPHASSTHSWTLHALL